VDHPSRTKPFLRDAARLEHFQELVCDRGVQFAAAMDESFATEDGKAFKRTV
jgi:hypothetical protein